MGAACNEDDISGIYLFITLFFLFFRQFYLFIYLLFKEGIGHHHGDGNSTQTKKKELRRFAYVYDHARVCVTAFI